MLNKSLRKSWVLLAGAVCLPALAGTDTLSDGLRRCAGQSDETQRLACFDALAAALPKIQTDKFGMTADIAHQRAPTEEYSHKSDVLTGKIRALRQGPRGEFIFTLDNDQVWRQDQPSPNISFSVGEAVRIEHGAMSSLWLAADHGRKTKVKRLS
ncbi:MAG: hypothetical protein ACJ8R9_11980 [Steroidobacteraceae bacterium]